MFLGLDRYSKGSTSQQLWFHRDVGALASLRINAVDITPTAYLCLLGKVVPNAVDPRKGYVFTPWYVFVVIMSWSSSPSALGYASN